MKKNYLLGIIVMGLIILSLYSTYAMFTSSVEMNNVIDMNTIMNYTFKINGTQELTVSSKTELRFNAIVENDMYGSITYGLYYKMINPNTLPEGIVIAEITDTTGISQGQLNENSKVTIPISIKNNSDIEVTMEIGVVTGYATESQGIEQLIYEDGQQPILDIVSPSEVGESGCNSTIKCTSKCNYKNINGEWLEYCECTTGKTAENMGYFAEFIQNMYNYNILSASNYKYNNVEYTKIDDLSLMVDIGGNIRYYGANPNNYVSFNNELWRIIGVFKDIDDGNGNTSDRIKIIRSKSLANRAWDTTGSLSWNVSTLNTYFNNTYLKNIDSSSQQLIDTVVWNLGGTEEYTPPDEAYKEERSNVVPPGNEATWLGKIALMYPSDYLYSSDLSKCTNTNWEYDQANCRDTAWLKNVNEDQWTITPQSFYNSSIIEIYSSGNLGASLPTKIRDIKPALYLRPEVKITGGTGTSTDPYTLSL